jgi:hypothetical protein
MHEFRGIDPKRHRSDVGRIKISSEHDRSSPVSFQTIRDHTEPPPRVPPNRTANHKAGLLDLAPEFQLSKQQEGLGVRELHPLLPADIAAGLAQQRNR